MTMQHAVALVAATIGIALAASGGGAAAQGPATPDQMVAALKQNLAESPAISLKGEEKSRKHERAYYGADGKLTKVPMDQPPPQAKPSGRGGRLKQKVVQNKKDEMTEYMERASNLIHLYVPPTPAQVQKAKDAGNMLMRPPQQGIVRVEFPDFIQPSDRMTIDVDGKALNLSAINVATYLDKPEDTVTLDVRFGALADGTSYTARTTLDAKAKNIRVVVENSGHRPLVP
jgi:hypothetical protein